jgi:DNA-binding transcriptional regulator YiaG
MITGKDLRHEREARRLSRKQAAAFLKVGERTLVRWETDNLPASALPVVEAFLRGNKPGGGVVTGRDIRRARERRRLSQEELAALLQVSSKSIGRWERGETIPKSALGALEQVLALGDHPDEPTLSEASNAELLAEVARRMEHKR